ITLAKQQGVDLSLVTTTNSVNDHQLLEDGDVDVDFNSHVPWFNDQLKQHKFTQTFVETVFLTPTGLYSQKAKTLADLHDGARIAISEDVPNQARSLDFLQKVGLITLAHGTDPSAATVSNIDQNPHHFRWVPVELETTPRVLPDVDAAIILGTVATAAGLKLENALAKEPADDPLWAIGIVARTRDIDNPLYKKVFALFNSGDVRDFITKTYPAEQVIPAFGPPVGVAKP
ncbi:MetQ/NlpA family ABC transporter substrate-binding protein, partial [Nocardia sp. NPDC059239]|uniref:MetQ/NlpA family ABC transporter substrate-binding protein n=1 Tax=Nocardia sp. NPDC059239 TaxID=3346785 RepID=UPI003680A09E